MDQGTFIGVGPNPEGPDLPLGLGMQLAQNPKAMAVFGKMSKAEKAALVRHVQSAITGEGAESLMEDAINQLSENKTHF